MNFFPEISHFTQDGIDKDTILRKIDWERFLKLLNHSERINKKLLNFRTVYLITVIRFGDDIVFIENKIIVKKIFIRKIAIIKDLKDIFIVFVFRKILIDV